MKLVTLASEIIKISSNNKLLSFFGGSLTPIKLLNLKGGGDNPAKNCFVLRDLIPINISKYVMIIRLKICTTGKILVEMSVPKIETSNV